MSRGLVRLCLLVTLLCGSRTQTYHLRTIDVRALQTNLLLLRQMIKIFGVQRELTIVATLTKNTLCTTTRAFVNLLFGEVYVYFTFFEAKRI